MEGINLALLPPLTVVQPVDYEATVADIATRAKLGNMSPSDPAYRVVLAAAYRETLVRHDANEQALGLMLAFANGAELDHLGATYYRDADGLPVVRFDGENDNDYRARLQLSPEGLSVAGPDGAYIFNAKTAHPDVKDVNVASPAPVEVVLTILSHTGSGVPAGEVLAAVDEYVWPRRPFTDQVTVQAAEIVTYSVNASLTMRKGPDPEVARKAALSAALLYARKRHVLGGWVTDSGLDAALTVEGVELVSLNGFDNIQCSKTQAPYCEAISVTIGGYV